MRLYSAGRKFPSCVSHTSLQEFSLVAVEVILAVVPLAQPNLQGHKMTSNVDNISW